MVYILEWNALGNLRQCNPRKSPPDLNSSGLTVVKSCQTLYAYCGPDGTRTRDLRRDRAAF